MGQAEHIGSRQPIYNIGQCEGLRKSYYRSVVAKLSVSEADSQLTTLPNVKSCAKLIMGPCGPS